MGLGVEGWGKEQSWKWQVSNWADCLCHSNKDIESTMGNSFREKKFFSISLDCAQYELWTDRVSTLKIPEGCPGWL